jgi:hypothetical protein
LSLFGEAPSASAIYGRRPNRKTDLSQIQKISAGEISKMQRTVFSGGAQRVQAPARRRGCNLAFFLKIGSSEVVKSHQKWTKVRISGALRRFFFGCAERRPNVFRGEKRTLGSPWLRLFGF